MHLLGSYVTTINACEEDDDNVLNMEDDEENLNMSCQQSLEEGDELFSVNNDAPRNSDGKEQNM